MNSVVLDSSALLALVCEETGSDVVARHLAAAMISAVNLAEVFSKAKDKRITMESLRWAVAQMRLCVVPFDEEMAGIVGSLREATRAAGLSLGDRCCLALGIYKQLPVLTTDRKWQDIPVGANIQVIR